MHTCRCVRHRSTSTPVNRHIWTYFRNIWANNVEPTTGRTCHCTMSINTIAECPLALWINNFKWQCREGITTFETGHRRRHGPQFLPFWHAMLRKSLLPQPVSGAVSTGRITMAQIQSAVFWCFKSMACLESYLENPETSHRSSNLQVIERSTTVWWFQFIIFPFLSM